MGGRIRSVALLLLIAVPAVGQPLVPPPVDGPIFPPPPVELGPPVCPVPPGVGVPYPAYPYAFPLDGCDPGAEGWSIYGPGSAPCAWLINWDLTVLKPHVKNQLRVNDGVPTMVGNYSNLDSSPLDWTVAPRLEIGYRFPDSLGAFILGYRFLVTEGTENLNPPDIRSRFDLNIIDFVYQTERVRPFGNWFFHTRIGGRILSSFYDTRNVTGPLTQSASNCFFGGGLVGAFDLERALDSVPGLALYTNLESSVVVGQVEQKFNTSFATPFGTFTDFSEQRGSQAVQSLQFQFGLSYTPPTWNTLRVRAAYQYEHWFDLGQIQQSNLEMNAHGLFLRLELAY